jgi:cellulose synthase/poly-beta-1,6-N-acetylglucosamine synthase-like glycosyltransferase
MNKGKVSGFTLNILERKALAAVGGFDERFNNPYTREDTDLLFKLLENGARIGVSRALMLHPVRRSGPGRFIRDGRGGIHEALLCFRHPRLYFTRLKWIDGLFFPAYYLGFYAGALWLLAAIYGIVPLDHLALAGIGGLTLASLAATVYVRLRNRRITAGQFPLLVLETLVAPFTRLFWVAAGFLRASWILLTGNLNADRRKVFPPLR